MTPSGTEPPAPAARRGPESWLALALAVIAALMVASAGPGSRFGWWHFRTAFQLMKYGGYAAVAAALVAVLALIVAGRRGRGRAVAMVALVLAAVTFFVPWNWRRGARGVPPIHDITTDFRDPPALEHSRALRDSLQINTAAYEGDSIAAQQRQAYPDIRPVMLTIPVDSAYGAAYRTAREMGWRIVEADPDRRRIEAVDETPWFGFKDDVVIRVSAASGISRVDVRSVSRVGRSDVGANAARIRKYVTKLRQNYPGAVADVR